MKRYGVGLVVSWAMASAWLACSSSPAQPDGGAGDAGDANVADGADGADDSAIDAMGDTNGGADAADVQLPPDAGTSPPFIPWGRVYGKLAGTSRFAVALDGNGATVLGGEWHNEMGQQLSLDFGGGGVSQGAFVAKVDFDGNHVFTKSFPLVNPAMYDICMTRGVAVDAANDVFAVGEVRGTCDVGGTMVTSGAFIAKLDPTGKVLFAKGYKPGQGQISGHAVAVDGAGNAYAAFAANGDTINFGGGVRTMAGPRIALVKLDNSGAWVWDRLWSAGQNGYVGGLAIDAIGRPVLTGVYEGSSLDLGGGALPATQSFTGFFVARLDAQGGHVFSKGRGLEQRRGRRLHDRRGQHGRLHRRWRALGHRGLRQGRRHERRCR
jgi:hypothetical protein